MIPSFICWHCKFVSSVIIIFYFLKLKEHLTNRFYFGGSKITVDSECSHEIKRCLLLGRKEGSLGAQSCPTLCNPLDCSTPDFPVHHRSESLFKFMSIKSVMPSNHLILCHPLLFLPSIFPSIQVFSNE